MILIPSGIYLYYSWSIIFIAIHIMTITSGVQLITSGNALIVEFNILENPSPDFGACLVVDWISLLFLSVVILISSMVLIYSVMYIGEHETDTNRFIAMVILFIMSIGLLILSPSLIFAILGWDGLGLVSFGLVIFYQNHYPISAGILTVYTNRLGDIALLLCIVLMWEGGSILNDSLSTTNMVGASTLLFLGAITNSAQLPFSSWLPAAIAAPTPVSSLVHSSTLVTAGIYLIIRFSSIFSTITFPVGMLGLMTIILAGLVACVENDLSKVIAISTLSQLGVIIFSLSILAPTLAFFHLITHALFNSMLFLGCGSLISLSWGNQDSRFYGSFAPSSPVINIIITAGSLALTGFPFLAGFYSSDMILESSLSSSGVVILIVSFLIGCVLTVAYGFNLLILAFMGGSLLTPLSPRSETTFMAQTILLLILTSISSGAFISWQISSELFVPYFSFFENILGSTILLVGSLLFLLKNMVPNCTETCLSDMGYLKWISTHFSSSMITSTSSLKGDFTWGELVGGQGLWSTLVNSSHVLNKLDVQNFRLILSTVSIWALLGVIS